MVETVEEANRRMRIYEELGTHAKTLANVVHAITIDLAKKKRDAYRNVEHFLEGQSKNHGKPR